MDTNTSPRFFTRHHWLGRYVWVFILIGALIAPTIMTQWLLFRFEQKYHFTISPKPFLFLIPGRIDLKNTTVIWKKEVTVRSGRVQASVQPFDLFSSQPRIKIRATDLNVKLKADRLNTFGKSEFQARELFADLIIKQNQPVDIIRLDITGNEIDFHIKQ